METLFFCMSLVVISVLLHLASLRVKMLFSANLVSGILFIFSAVLVISLILSYFLSKKYSFFPQGIWQNLHVIIFFVPVMLSYIITFVALEDDSPTMTIVGFVEQAEKEGRSLKQIRQIISDEALILPRIDAMVTNEWVEYRDNKYYITEKGKSYNRIFALGAKLANITREG